MNLATFWEKYAAEVETSMVEYEKACQKSQLDLNEAEKEVDELYSTTEKTMQHKLQQSIELAGIDNENIPIESAVDTEIQEMEDMMAIVESRDADEDKLNNKLRAESLELFTYCNASQEEECLQNYQEILRMFTECSLDTSGIEHNAELELKNLEAKYSHVNAAVSDLTSRRNALKKKMISADPYDVSSKELKTTLRIASESLRVTSKKLINIRLQIRGLNGSSR